jgi:hypothetical protein
MNHTMELVCAVCRTTQTLDAQAQREILQELKLPAHRKIVECSCAVSQFILAARWRIAEAP